MNLEKRILMALFSGLCVMNPETLVEQISVTSPDKIAIIQKYINQLPQGNKECIVEYPAIDMLMFPDKIIIKYGKPIYYPPEIKKELKQSYAH